MGKDWVDIMSALMTPTVAVIGVAIAYQQGRINKGRFRHELYHRRMKVFSRLMQYLSAIPEHESFPRDEYAQWLSSSYEGYFLFDDKMWKYFEEINAKSRQFRSNRRKMKIRDKEGEPDQEERNRLCETDEELEIWFETQFDKARTEFSRFLRLEV